MTIRDLCLKLSLLLPKRVRKRLRYWLLRLVARKKHSHFQQMRESNSDYSLRQFDEKQCIFVHLPKCAGVSVNKALFGNLGAGHMTLTQLSFAFSPKEMEDYFKFTIVRHPLDRLVSAFHFLKKGGFDPEDAKWADEHLTPYSTFQDFVENWLTPENIWLKIHFQPQHFFLEDCWGEIDLDFVARFERLETDFRQICDRLGSRVELPHTNKSVRGHFWDYYTPQTARKVADIYRRDMELFGYVLRI